MSAPIERARECLDYKEGGSLHTNNFVIFQRRRQKSLKMYQGIPKAPCFAVKNILWLNIFILLYLIYKSI